VNLCVNCKHFIGSPEKDIRAQVCKHRLTPEPYVDPVTGKEYPSSAYVMRDSETFCGKEGRWFEPKDE